MAITKTYSDGGSGKHCKLEPFFIAPLFSFYFTDDEKTPLAAPHIDIFKLYPNESLQARIMPRSHPTLTQILDMVRYMANMCPELRSNW